jgi:hypothetical protein
MALSCSKSKREDSWENANRILTSNEIADIQEAVFRYMFEYHPEAKQKEVRYYYLSINHKNTSNKFMKRFKDYDPPVKKLSQCISSLYGVKDKRTEEKGIIFQLGSIRFNNKDEIVVSGGHYAGGKSSTGYAYTVQRLNNQWVVTKEKLGTIS